MVNTAKIYFLSLKVSSPQKKSADRIKPKKWLDAHHLLKVGVVTFSLVNKNQISKLKLKLEANMQPRIAEKSFVFFATVVRFAKNRIL